MAYFVNCMKKEEINGGNFGHLYLFKFGMCTHLPHLYSKILIGSNQLGITELHMCENQVFSSYQYTHNVVHQIFGLHDTLLCVLIAIQTIYVCSGQ